MTKNNKHTVHIQQNLLVVLLVGCVCFGIAYASFVWATDSGRIMAYVVFFAAAYYGVRFCVKSGTHLFRKK